jgi:hypothetical protein
MNNERTNPAIGRDALAYIEELMTPEEIAIYKARACSLYDRGIEPICF